MSAFVAQLRTGLTVDAFFYDASGKVWNPLANSGMGGWVTWADAAYQAYRVHAVEDGASGTYAVPAYPGLAVRWVVRLRSGTLAGSRAVYEDDVPGCRKVVGTPAAPGEPGDPVLTWEECKAFLRIFDDAEQPVVMALAAAAQAAAERHMNTSLTPRRLRADFQPGDTIELPMGPVDDSDPIVVTTLPDGDDVSGSYTLTRYDRSDLLTGTVWHTGGVRVEYTAGLPFVPPDVRSMLLVDVSTRYDDRQSGDMPKGAEQFYRRRCRGSVYL